MASLNLSTNGPSISKSYQSVVNAPPPSGAVAASPTYGQWAVFTVSAPLVNAFQQDSANKESVLKVQSTGEGELVDFIDEFSDGRTQFGYVKVKDPNTGLPKNALVAWCGEGVPERTKGYFGSHLAAVAKLLHGYHVQITARSDRDLTPEGIVQKVADSSGSKYSAGDAPPPVATLTKPAVSAKPAFTPTQSSRGNTGFTSARAVAQRDADVDEDGWGRDAPPVTRTQLEKVQPAYQPTKVNMRELTSQPQSSGNPMANRSNQSTGPEPVKGVYQPIGKVDIAAIKAQARESGNVRNDRPEIVKGAYEPVGKVDIAAIRAKAQKPSDASPAPQTTFQPTNTGGSATGPDESRSLADRSAAFTQPERLTSLPKPKVSSKFGGGSTFTGTKAPVPGGFKPKAAPAAPPVGIASRTFADQGGKTPAQIWAEKKARERGQSGSGDNIASTGLGSQSPIATQTSGGGEWKSGYSGKTWAPVQTSHTGKSAGSIDQQRTGELDPQPEEEAPQSSAGGISSIRDRFSGAPPMGAPASGFDGPAPEPDVSSKPNRGVGIPIPGLPRPTAAHEQEAPSLPTPPPQPPRSPTPPTPDVRSSSPIRVAMPVGRSAVTDAHEEQISSPPSMPIRSMQRAAPEPEDDEPDTGPDPARATAHAAAVSSVGAAAVDSAHPGAQASGKKALVQYDYEKAEDNEIELKEGEYVTDIEMVDEDWWMGKNEHGETGLFPSNYVELVEGDEGESATSPAQPSHPSIPLLAAEDHPAPAAAEHHGGPTATALYDYEAAEDNEISFPDGAKITNLEFPDEDWWMGEYRGKSGLFPANYVQLDE